jgi:chemotaxis protein methyltransferase CheR
MVEFRQLNLAGPWPAVAAADVVLLRNVLIYFDVETKKAILERTRQTLRPAGYLFLGGAETTLNLSTAFERVEFPRSGCYRLRAH